MPADPFDTAGLRRGTLTAWSASAARLREDANAEEALVVGGYAGRVLVELAANAVDAAQAAGVPARLRIRLDGGELRVANTGAPLSADGVAALASLRASAKRGDISAVGHFGVGFTAVLAWTRTPSVISRTGGVRFDPDAARRAVEDLGDDRLDAELAARGGQPPTLRLPWPVSGEAPPAGFDTEVRLPLPADQVDDVRSVLADPDAADDLLWALPDLTEIDIAGRDLAAAGIRPRIVMRRVDLEGLHVLTDGGEVRRYRTAHRSGHVPTELLAARPVEERHRAHWWITWAHPLDDPDTDPATAPDGGWDGGGAPAAVRARTIGAPTPTDEPLSMPARLIGTFPVDDTRRRLAAGPLADFMLAEAVRGYLDLVAGGPPDRRWRLLPATGFPLGPVDAVLRAGVLDAVSRSPVLVTAVGDEVSPRDAVILPGLGAAGARLVGQAVPGLLPPMPAGAVAALRAVGVGILSPAAASGALAEIDRPPEFWGRLYAELAIMDVPPSADDLADIPVPLATGRRVIGARATLLPVEASGASDASTTADATAVTRAATVIPGLRVVHPDAAHPLLLRLGARAADPSTVLADPAVADALRGVHDQLDDADPEPRALRRLAGAVLDLVAAGGRADPDTLGLLVLTDADGEPWPAGELLAPDAPIAGVLAGDADLPMVGAEWSRRYPPDVLAAVGVRRGFRVQTVTDPDDPAVDLPDLDEWLDQARQPDAAGPVDAFDAVTDLDLIDPERWPAALALLEVDPDARRCLLGAPGTPGSPSDPPTGSGVVPYTTWWLARYARIGGRAPREWRIRSATDLAGLYDPLPIALDDRMAAACGVCVSLPATARDDPQAILDRLADPDRAIPGARVPEIVAALLDAAPAGRDLRLPWGVRTLAGGVVDAETAVVLDRPWWVQVLPPDRLVPGGADPQRVANLLDLPLASASGAVRLRVGGTPNGRTAAAPGTSTTAAGTRGGSADATLWRAAAALGRDPADLDVRVVDELHVSVADAAGTPVAWWADADGVVTTASAEAIGRAVAWSADAWPLRHRVVAAAADDPRTLAEDGVG